MSNDTVVGSKTGIMRRTISQLDGSDRDVRKTGVFKREKTSGALEDDGTQHREPPAPPSLPEVNQDDGGTTGLVDFDSEGTDTARRENHPRQ